MKFSMEDCITSLRRTPIVIQSLLKDLPESWINSNEGEGTWSPKQIIAHLIHGERTDWILRAEIMLDDEADKNFVPFDMNAHFKMAETMTTRLLQNEFSKARSMNVSRLIAWDLSEEDLDKTGIHPEFGEVTLRQHLATWVIHDHSHVSQICRVFVKNYKEEVGPWGKYHRLLRD